MLITNDASTSNPTYPARLITSKTGIHKLKSELLEKPNALC